MVITTMYLFITSVFTYVFQYLFHAYSLIHFQESHAIITSKGILARDMLEYNRNLFTLTSMGFICLIDNQQWG